MRSLWLIPLAPAAAAALIVVGGRWFSRVAAGVIAASAVAVSVALSVWASVALLGLDPSARVRADELGTWIPSIPLDTVSGVEMFSVAWTVRLDPLAAILLLAIGSLGFLTDVYAAASLRRNPRDSYARVFCALNLFCACMLLLVLGANYLVMFAGWAGATLCSGLLIGAWHDMQHRREIATAARLVNGAADAALLMAVVLVFFTFGTLDFREVANDVTLLPRASAGVGRLSMICLLLVIAAAGRTAQVALQSWLPRKSDVPAAALALMQASMVAAGVYLLARNAVLFAHTLLVMPLVAAAGLLSAAIAASLALLVPVS